MTFLKRSKCRVVVSRATVFRVRSPGLWNPLRHACGSTDRTEAFRSTARRELRRARKHPCESRHVRLEPAPEPHMPASSGVVRFLSDLRGCPDSRAVSQYRNRAAESFRRPLQEHWTVSGHDESPHADARTARLRTRIETIPNGPIWNLLSSCNMS